MTSSDYIEVVHEFALYCDGTKQKPLFRGIIHEILFLVIPIGSIPMFFICRSFIAYVSVILYVLACVTCYGASSQYHRRKWSIDEEIIISKFDGFGIFVLMGFNSAPVFIFLAPAVGYIVLYMNTLLCIIGFVVVANIPPGKPLCYTLHLNRYFMTGLYFIVAFIIGVLILPTFCVEANQLELLCWIIAGTCYTIGGLVYAFKAPVLWPNTFGYHEAFHALTAVSSIMTYICNYSIISRMQ